MVGTDIGFGFAIDEGIKKQQLSVLLKVMIVSVITGLVGIVVIGSLILPAGLLCVCLDRENIQNTIQAKMAQTTTKLTLDMKAVVMKIKTLERVHLNC